MKAIFKKKSKLLLIFGISIAVVWLILAIRNHYMHPNPAVMVKSECPYKDFDSFFGRFSEDADFQRKFTQFPLIKEFSEDGASEPQVVKVHLKRNQVKFPIFPNKKTVVDERLVMRVNHISENVKQVDVEIPESDAYIVYYTFERHDCWYLTKFEDLSL